MAEDGRPVAGESGDSLLRENGEQATTSCELVLEPVRLPTGVDADEVLVERGQVIARGTHDELMEESDSYRDFVAALSPSDCDTSR